MRKGGGGRAPFFFCAFLGPRCVRVCLWTRAAWWHLGQVPPCAHRPRVRRPAGPSCLAGAEASAQGGQCFLISCRYSFVFLLNEVCVLCLPWDCMRRRTTHVRACKAQKKKKKSKSRAVWRCHQHTREGWGGRGSGPPLSLLAALSRHPAPPSLHATRKLLSAPSTPRLAPLKKRWEEGGQ